MNPYQFFLKHAGYSYDPATQSPIQGRVQSARRLAAAERKARDEGISFQWSVDPNGLSSDWEEAHNETAYPIWQCVAWPTKYTEGDRVYSLASLGAIDFGRDGEPWGDPYRRVVEAELALEALDNLKGEV